MTTPVTISLKVLVKHMILGICILFSFYSNADRYQLCGVERPPFVQRSGQSLTQGLSLDIYREAFSRMGHSFQAVAIPWDKCRAAVISGEMDAMIDGPLDSGIISSRQATSAYILAVYVRKGFTQHPFTWDRLRGKRLGILKDYPYSPRVNAQTGFQRYYASSHSELIQKLLQVSVNFVLMDMLAAQRVATQQYGKLKMLKPISDAGKLYLGFHQKHQNLVKQYDRVITQMDKDGSLDRLYLNYLAYSYRDVMSWLK
ncbi:substrate-binding periplasmic protein [Algicola sagamiensis]|uniref:substrate-binding periplasmic protein n=1 Tax=Algicola sagamiensis TaxID=163869 RepID=UPI00036206A5|nr:transporter substrate-binding domain-containing protein [Algicola sagamiensis]